MPPASKCPYQIHVSRSANRKTFLAIRKGESRHGSKTSHLNASHSLAHNGQMSHGDSTAVFKKGGSNFEFRTISNLELKAIIKDPIIGHLN